MFKHTREKDLSVFYSISKMEAPRSKEEVPTMPYTGQKYGLNQDWWTDERLDPFKSTEAAADYLQKLYGDFGDWPTAIAAYNAGEGKIGRAKQGTGGRDFFEIKSRNHMLDDKAQLRDETKQYVPRYLAVTKIMLG